MSNIFPRRLGLHCSPRYFGVGGTAITAMGTVAGRCAGWDQYSTSRVDAASFGEQFFPDSPRAPGAHAGDEWALSHRAPPDVYGFVSVPIGDSAAHAELNRRRCPARWAVCDPPPPYPA